MTNEDSLEPVRIYAPEHRARVLAFLELVDQKFVPPLSSDLRHGSLEAYLDYSLADGQGRVLLYEHDHRMIGFLAFRYERNGDECAGDSVYLSNMCVSESRMGTVLISLYQAMIRQVEKERSGEVRRIWAKTWRQNRASARTLERVGLQLVRTVHDDPTFRGCRDTLIFEGPWVEFVRNVQMLSSAREGT